MKSKKLIFISIVALLAIALVLGVVYFFGRYDIVERSNSSGSVCSNDIIADFNNLYDNPENNSQDKSRMSQDIKSKTDFDKDINCLFIIDWLDGSNNYEKIKKLSDNGQSPNIKIKNIRSIDYLKPIDEVKVVDARHRGKGGI